MTKLSLARIQKELRTMDPELSGSSPAFHAAVVMFSALQVGQDVRKLARFTRYPEKEVREYAENLKRSGVWRQGITHHSGWFATDGTGGMSFWLDVNVALGYVERASAIEGAATKEPVGNPTGAKRTTEKRDGVIAGTPKSRKK